MPRDDVPPMRSLVLAALAFGVVGADVGIPVRFGDAVGVRAAQADTAAHPPPLAIGAQAPDFHLQGIDGKTYSLASFAKSKALVVLFTAVHCPTAEIYEGRIKRLIADYRPKGVAFAVIQPNNAKALQARRNGLHRPWRLDGGDEDPGGAQELRFPVPVRRRHAGNRDEVRPGVDAARLHLRPEAHPQVPRPRRQQSS